MAAIKKIGPPAVPTNSFKNLTRAMRIPNMCYVLKLDNGKVVSIANEQTELQTELCQHPVPYYNIDVMYKNSKQKMDIFS